MKPTKVKKATGRHCVMTVKPSQEPNCNRRGDIRYTLLPAEGSSHRDRFLTVDHFPADLDEESQDARVKFIPNAAKLSQQSCHIGVDSLCVLKTYYLTQFAAPSVISRVSDSATSNQRSNIPLLRPHQAGTTSMSQPINTRKNWTLTPLSSTPYPIRLQQTYFRQILNAPWLPCPWAWLRSPVIVETVQALYGKLWKFLQGLKENTRSSAG
ncbi:hypothetical protein INR49_026423 [Caranx melampygus]|nr:hypothetical protein INR49_026423 [Caranx melampygus]